MSLEIADFQYHQTFVIQDLLKLKVLEDHDFVAALVSTSSRSAIVPFRCGQLPKKVESKRRLPIEVIKSVKSDEIDLKTIEVCDPEVLSEGSTVVVEFDESEAGTGVSSIGTGNL